jgi:hypothetical protein
MMDEYMAAGTDRSPRCIDFDHEPTPRRAFTTAKAAKALSLISEDITDFLPGCTQIRQRFLVPVSDFAGSASKAIPRMTVPRA